MDRAQGSYDLHNTKATRAMLGMGIGCFVSVLVLLSYESPNMGSMPFGFVRNTGSGWDAQRSPILP